MPGTYEEDNRWHEKWYYFTWCMLVCMKRYAVSFSANITDWAIFSSRHGCFSLLAVYTNTKNKKTWWQVQYISTSMAITKKFVQCTSSEVVVGLVCKYLCSCIHWLIPKCAKWNPVKLSRYLLLRWIVCCTRNET